MSSLIWKEGLYSYDCGIPFSLGEFNKWVENNYKETNWSLRNIDFLIVAVFVGIDYYKLMFLVGIRRFDCNNQCIYYCKKKISIILISNKVFYDYFFILIINEANVVVLEYVYEGFIIRVKQINL